MKITKKRLMEIIKEELGSMEQGSSEQSPEQDVKAKSELAKKMKEISMQIPKMQLDSAEIIALNSIFSALLSYANDNTGGQRLKVLLDKMKPILGIK
jgi:hypothetical protein